MALVANMAMVDGLQRRYGNYNRARRRHAGTSNSLLGRSVAASDDEEDRFGYISALVATCHAFYRKLEDEIRDEARRYDEIQFGGII